MVKAVLARMVEFAILALLGWCLAFVLAHAYSQELDIQESKVEAHFQMLEERME